MPRPPSELEMGTSTAGWWLLQSWRHKWKKREGTGMKQEVVASCLEKWNSWIFMKWMKFCWGVFFFHPAICIDEQGRIMSLDMYLYLPLTIGKFWFSVHHWPAPFCGLSVFTKRNVGAKVPGKEGGGSKNAQFTTTVITWDQMVITSWKNHPITRITPGVFGRFRCDKSFCLFGAQVFLEEF